jgi:RHS repeat-associated protein
LTWDREARLSTVNDEEGSTRYIYDANGNRLIAREPTGKTLYLPGQEVRWNATTGQTCTRFYDYNGQTIASRTVNGLTWLASDPQGTSQVAVTEQGQQVQQRRQTPFGTPRGTVPAWPNRRGFVDGDVDSTGMIHLGAREYDPAIGRFISVDPIMVLTDPQQMQGYTYANNNPITWSDPTGLCGTCISELDGHAGNTNNGPKPRDTTRPNAGNGGGPSCVEYCSSPADNRLREIWNTPSNGKGGTTGTAEVGGAQVTYDRMALGIYGEGYGSLTPDQRSHVDYVVWSMNNPEAAKAYNEFLAMIRDGQYSLVAELTGAADADRCFSNGDVGSCIWTAIGLTPAKALQLTKLLRLFNKACSFSADTKVVMADGTTKPIAGVSPGDEVLATDPETGRQTAATVVGVWFHEDTLVDLQLTQSGQLFVETWQPSTGDGLPTVTTTADHLFWNHTDREWQPAHALAPGDRLLGPDGSLPAVLDLLVYTERQGYAYNLTVADIHTYYVLAGKMPVLVHNCGGLVDNMYPGQQLTDELLAAERLGVSPIYAGTRAFDQAVASGGNYLWAVTDSGALHIAPALDDIKHTVLTAGGPVRAAGFVTFARGSVAEITDFTGHYTPRCRCGGSLQIGSDAFRGAGIVVPRRAEKPYGW